MKKRILALVSVVILAVLVPGVMLAQSDPFAGTWKLNTAKSKFTPGPAPQSLTQTIEAQGDGQKVSAEGTAGDGSKIAWSYTANYDSKDNPVSGTGAPNGADTFALKRINPNAIETTLKKAGKVVGTARLRVSKDGKVMKIAAKGTNASGQPTNNVIILDKQ